MSTTTARFFFTIDDNAIVIYFGSVFSLAIGSYGFGYVIVDVGRYGRPVRVFSYLKFDFLIWRLVRLFRIAFHLVLFVLDLFGRLFDVDQIREKLRVDHIRLNKNDKVIFIEKNFISKTTHRQLTYLKNERNKEMDYGNTNENEAKFDVGYNS